MDNENGLPSEFDNDEEKPKTLMGWLKATSPVIKILVIASFIIILGNVLMIAYLSSVMPGGNVDSGGRDGAPADGRPADAREPMKELDYEKRFVENYEKSMVVSGRLLQAIETASEHGGDWRHALAVDITLLKTLANGAQEVVPPNSPGYKGIHEAYLKAFADFKWAADNLVAAADENDKALQDRCVQKLNKGREGMNEAIENLKDVYTGN